jgi:hypothetical protein
VAYQRYTRRGWPCALRRISGTPAWPMKVQVRIEIALKEALYRFGVFGGNMPVSQMLANHGSVLGFHQAAVIGVPGPRLGLFHPAAY